MRALSFACLLALAPALAPSSARAQSSAADEEARALFAAGEVAYRDGRFEDALGYFRRAHELSGRSELLYNVGLAAANAGHDREALEAFEQYLAASPDSPNRALVEGRIAGLRRRVEEDDAAQRRAEEAERLAAEAAAREREREAASRASTAGLGSAGVGLAVAGGVLAAGGAVLIGVGAADVSSVEGAPDGTPWVDLAGANDRAPILTGIGIASAALGLAALGTGVALIVAGGSSSPEQVSVTFGPGSVAIRGRL